VISLSWTAWKRYCRWMMIICLILALVFGSAWYVDLQRTAEVDRPTHAQSAGPKPVEAQQPRSSVVCAPVEWENHFPNYCGWEDGEGLPEDWHSDNT
jgi:hypothetical protein